MAVAYGGKLCRPLQVASDGAHVGPWHSLIMADMWDIRASCSGDLGSSFECGPPINGIKFIMPLAFGMSAGALTKHTL